MPGRLPLGRKSLAVIFNQHFDLARVAPDRQPGRAGPGVLDYVVEALLDDAVEIDSRILRTELVNIINLSGELDLAGAGHPFHEFFQGLRQAYLVQMVRPEIVGDLPDFGNSL